jgi:hypothetical protein
MCGIICVVSRPSGRPLPIAADILSALDRAIAAGDKAAIGECAQLVAEADAALRGDAGLGTLYNNAALAAELISRTERLEKISYWIE